MKDYKDWLVLWFLVTVTSCTVPITDRIEDLEVQLNQRELRLQQLGK
jgi:hypothetical protein